MSTATQPTAMQRYRQNIDQRMMALAALGLTEDFYAIPLREPASGTTFLSGAIPLPQPGRRLQVEIYKDQDDEGQPCAVAKLSGLLGMGISGKMCLAMLRKDTDCKLTGLFDFHTVVFQIRVMSHPGPHLVKAIATLAQLLPDEGSDAGKTEGFAAATPAPFSPSK